ncbi:MAG: acyltransferase [Actinomycetes bacterium]
MDQEHSPGILSVGSSALVSTREDQAPPVFTPPPGSPRFPLVDGLRALAAVTILIYHAAFLSGYVQFGRLGSWASNLNVGVTIFFVISGFLIYRPYVRAQLAGTKGPALTRFYRRRLLRIVPAYWVALTLLSLYPGSTDTFADWPKFYFFLQVYTPSPPHEGLFQAWSLCVEMSFYLLLPFYAMIIGTCFKARSAAVRVRSELALLALLSAGSAIATYVWSDGALSPLVQGLPRFMFWFALGMGLAIVSVRVEQRQSQPRWVAALDGRLGRCWALALALFIVLGAVTQVPTDGISFAPKIALIQWAAGGVIALLIVLPAVFSSSTRSFGARVLRWRPIVWLGLVSYGLFLWQAGPLLIIVNQQWISSGHWVVRFVEFAALAIALTVPLAALSYYLIERPFLRLKDPRRKPA